MGILIPEYMVNLYSFRWTILMAFLAGFGFGMVSAAMGKRLIDLAKKMFWPALTGFILLISVIILFENLSKWRNWSEKLDLEKKGQTAPSWSWNSGGKNE